MKYLIGNWKMNLGVGESLNLFTELAEKMDRSDSLEIVLCPSMLALVPIFAKNKGRFSLGAQDCFYEDKGSFTGEVSAEQIGAFVDYCLVGHSERRQILGENDIDVNRKIKACLKHGIRPILCVGETLSQRQKNETETVLRGQLDGALMGVQANDITRILIAYEPVWAIGSGEVPSMIDLELATHSIKTQIAFMYGDLDAPVLYGGSVDDANAESIMKLPQIDGLLVGSSSLNPEKFAIIGKIISEGMG